MVVVLSQLRWVAKRPGMSETKEEWTPAPRKTGKYKIPLILGAIGLLLMISPFFYSAYVDATVGQGDPNSVSAGWSFVWAFYRFTPAGIIVLIIALFMGIVEKISSMPSGDNSGSSPGRARQREVAPASSPV